MDPINLTDDLLLSVMKPARYIGEEINIIKKPWTDDKVKVCLSYPDTYEIGMSHLGLKILYHILNRRDDILCERVFCPWLDMEKQMREKNIPLFSLESRMPLKAFDIVGFSLQHELTYTNLINMLSLAGIPLESAERLKDESSPLIIAGGTCAVNPEPLADIIDLFLIGDAEEAIVEVIDTFQRAAPACRRGRCSVQRAGKEKMLAEMAKIEGVYVPSIPMKVKKRVLKNLSPDDFPTKPVVPYISVIHDRITLEIMRGCPNSCRFCQARGIYNPVRVRSRDEILRLAEETYKNTGFDEISLLSLSSSNYPGIGTLINELNKRFKLLGVGISMPSLRIEEQLKLLPSLIGDVKKSGLTLAPEAGSEKMYQIIGKDINHEHFFAALKEAYRAGWRKVKLYFMIGLPEEDESDIEAIAVLSDKAALLKKEFSKYPADVTASISFFIPKPHTPFERKGMASGDELRARQDFLIKKMRPKRYLKVNTRNTYSSILEAVFSRGDRRLGKALIAAWELGARFDDWTESFNPDIWEAAFAKTGIDKNTYLREYSPDEVLPWSNIIC